MSSLRPPHVKVPPPHRPLLIPVYVIQMGWHRWGLRAKRRWAMNLRHACQETILECERIIRHIDEEAR